MSNVIEPSFDILRSAVLEIKFDLLNSETFEPEEEGKQLGAAIQECFDAVDVSDNNIRRVSIGCETDWIKCACGTVNIGIRLEQQQSSNESKESDKTKKQKPNNSSNTTKLSMFGGSDGDRTNAGDGRFWTLVEEKAPSITAEQWTEFCTSSNSIPGLVVIVEEPDEDDEEDDEDWPPHAKYPDVIHSTIILTLAEKILGSTVITKGEESPWVYDGPSDAIECDGNKLSGHAWIRQQL